MPRDITVRERHGRARKGMTKGRQEGITMRKKRRNKRPKEAADFKDSL